MDFYLKSTGDRTDRTGDIQRMLKEQGCCVLGPGVFWVRDIKMPDGTNLTGQGNATKLLLDPEGTYCVGLGSFCAVRDLAVMGSEEPIELPETVGDRHGLVFEGTATRRDWANQTRNSMISGIFASGFTGGGITCRYTGYNTMCAMNVSDCHLWNCGAGIYIPRLSEYHKFTNVLCGACLYGCVNNGGNNMFLNCGFNANVTGFLIDNSDGESYNNAHGSAVGCTFNHSGKNQGIGIHIRGANHGYVFSGCQLFYSRVVLENSSGILFDNFNCGKQIAFTVKGGDLTVFSNSVFYCPPDPLWAEDNPAVKFINCFTRDGKEITLC